MTTTLFAVSDGFLGNIADQVSTFLPNIAAALGVLLGGWLVAIIVSRIAGAAIGKTGLNQSLAGFFPAKAGKPANPSKSIAKILYYLLMLFVLIAFFNTLNLPMVTAPLQGFLDQIFAFLPKLFAAGALGLVAWIAARVGKTVTQSGLEAADIDTRFNSLTSGASQLGSGVVGAVDRVADGVGGAVGGVVNTVGGAAQGVAGTVGGVIDGAAEIVLGEDELDDIILDDADYAGGAQSYAGSNVPPGAPGYPSTGATPPAAQPIQPVQQIQTGSTALTPVATQPRTIATQTAGAGDSLKLTETIPDTVYWLILLIFLPAILGALQMKALLDPVQSMMAKATDYLPNIIGAAIIFAIGWFVAKIVSQIVSNLAASAGVNSLSSRLGVDGAMGNSSKISDILGIVVKVMILFPALIASLNALKIDAITAPAMDILNKITGMVPGFIGGALTVGIAYFIGKLVSELVTDLLAGTGVNSWPAKMGLAASGGGSEINVAGIVGKFILVTTVFFAFVQALPMMGLDALGGYANEFVGFAAQILVGLVVMGGGFVLANFLGKTINESGMENATTLANVAKIGIMALSAAMGLQRMGLGSSIVNLAFGLILGAIALAAGIAFGWGGRDAAKKICDRYVG